MSKNKRPSIMEQIVERLYSEGAQTVSQLCKSISFPYKSVSNKCIELRKLGLGDRDDDGLWSLREGVSPQTLKTGELDLGGEEGPTGEEGPEDEGTTEATQKLPPILKGKGISLDQRSMFIKHMADIGVSPKEAIPTVADLFFGGDIDSLKWLNHVLQRQAAGYVTHHQRRLIMGWWAQTRGLPYNEDEFVWDEEGKRGEARGERDKEGKEKKPMKPLDPGMGWRIDKDKAGDWVAIPGGPMTYEDAVAAAERRHLIAQYGKGTAAEGISEEGEEAEGQPAGKRGAPKESLLEKMFFKMFESVFDTKKGREDGDSETVRRLTERIENMEKERNEERFERLEGLIANMASRDPWDEYDKIEQMKQRLGVGSPVVTDQSPAVQLIKDTTDKLDKNVARLVGVIERTALRSEEFSPEQKRSPQEREQKAGELLGEVQSRERSRGLRRETFGF